MSGVLAERLQRCVGAAQCGSVLLKRLFPLVAPVHLTQLLVVHLARADAESADGNCKRPQVRVLDFFLHIDTVCARTFHTRRHQK